MENFTFATYVTFYFALGILIQIFFYVFMKKKVSLTGIVIFPIAYGIMLIMLLVKFTDHVLKLCFKPLGRWWRNYLKRFSIFNKKLGDAVDREKSRNHYYSLNANQILYCGGGNSFELGIQPMDADVDSFEVLDFCWSKDKEHVFLDSHSLAYIDIDVESFRLIDYTTAVDDKQVYRVENHHSSKPVVVVEGADPSTYEPLKDNWARDRNRYFFLNKPVEVDYDSFEILSTHFSKDKCTAYYCLPAVFGFDEYEPYFRAFETAGELEFLSPYYMRDEEKVYFFQYTENDEYVYRLGEIVIKQGDEIKTDIDHLWINELHYRNGRLQKEE